MTIATRLKINVLLSAVVMFFMIAAFGMALMFEKEASEQEIFADKLMKGMFELNELTHDYLRHPEERPQEQWRLKYDSLSAILNEAPRRQEQMPLVLRISRGLADMRALFDDLSESYEDGSGQAGAKEESPVVREKRDQLVDLIDMKSREISGVAVRIAADSTARIEKVSREVAVLFPTLAALIVTITVWSSLRIRRSIADQISRLRQGAEIIGSGDLDHRIGMASNDEIGQLSREFDTMTERLKTTTASRDELMQEVSDRKRAEKALRRSQEDLNHAQAVAHIGSWRLDVRRNELLWSDETHRMFGISRETPLTYEVFLTAVHPDDRDAVDRAWKGALRGEPYDIEHRITAGGDVKWVREQAELEFDRQGVLLGGFGTVQDITQQKSAEEALLKARQELEGEILERRKNEELISKALQEKETLLRELYHRTKNNMNVISGLISLQTASIPDHEVLQMFRDLQHRIRSMSLVHKKLYQTRDLTNVNLRDYIQDLANELLCSYRLSDGRVSMRLDITGFALSIDTVIPCGLIINELITNSLKYAFPEGREGEIAIEGRMSEDGEIRIRYRDNGIGLPEGFDLNSSQSLGLKLVRRLTEGQLGGRVELGTGAETEFIITFREPHYRERI